MKKTVTSGDADSVAPPGEGGAFATTTSEQTINLTSLIGQYVNIQSEGDDCFFACVAGATDALTLTAAALGSHGIPQKLGKSPQGYGFVVQKDRPYLRVKNDTTTALLRITRS